VAHRKQRSNVSSNHHRENEESVTAASMKEKAWRNGGGEKESISK